MESEYQLYLIVTRGKYGDIEYYAKKKDVRQLAFYLNEMIKIGFYKEIIAVYPAENYLSSSNERMFFPIEYEKQKFFESYEERLIEKHRILAV